MPVAYLTIANLVRLGMSFCCYFLVRSQYFASFLSLCWIEGGHRIHPPTEGLFCPTGIEPTPYRNSASEVAGLQLYATAPDTLA